MPSSSLIDTQIRIGSCNVDEEAIHLSTTSITLQLSPAAIDHRIYVLIEFKTIAKGTGSFIYSVVSATSKTMRKRKFDPGIKALFDKVQMFINVKIKVLLQTVDSLPNHVSSLFSIGSLLEDAEGLMSGIVKSAMAKKFYNDRAVGDHFGLYVWCAVSQRCDTKKVLGYRTENRIKMPWCTTYGSSCSWDFGECRGRKCVEKYRKKYGLIWI